MASGIEVANAYIALYTQMPGVKRDIERSLGASDVQSSVEDAGRKSGSRWGAGLAGAVGGAVAVFASKAVDSIGQSIDGAIARVDIMNNFPKVMENLGYSSEEASDAIDTMSDRLSGLPTTLQHMAGMVQQLAPLTDGLDEATDLSLALNNALLAGGKDTQIQANAMEQYSQMLALGKVDMAAWRSMVSAMPGQMDQLAQSILGTESKSMDLYQAMKDGAVGFDELNDAILLLNDEGTGNFASFADQASSATEGIATNQANLQTAITRGLADVIQTAEPLITAVTLGATELANTVFPLVAGFLEAAFAVAEWAQANQDWLIPAGIFVGVIAAIVTGIKLVTAAKLAWAAAMGGAQIATYLSGASLTIYNGILKAQTLGTQIAAGAQRLWNAALSANPIGIVITLVAALVAALVWFFTQTEIGQEIWANFTAFLGEAWANVSQWFIEAWDNIISFFDSALQWLVDLFLNWTFLGLIIQHWDEIVAIFDTSVELIKGFFEGLWTSISDGFIGAINVVIDLLNGFLSGLNKVGGFLSDVTGGSIGFEIGTIPHLAAGATVLPRKGGTLAVLAEAGRAESVVDTGLVNRALEQGIQGTGTQQSGPLVEITAEPGVDPHEVARNAANEVAWIMEFA